MMEIFCDQVLRQKKYDPALICFQRNEPGNNRWDFQHGKTFMISAGCRVHQTDQQLQTQVRYHGERMCRIDPHRCQYRQDLPFKNIVCGLLLRRIQIGITEDHQRFCCKFRQDHFPEISVLTLHQFTDPAVQFCQQFAGIRLSAPGNGSHADHEKFIQIAAEDRKKLQPFQQWISKIRSLIKDPAVEFQPADVAIDEMHIVHVGSSR